MAMEFSTLEVPGDLDKRRIGESYGSKPSQSGFSKGWRRLAGDGTGAPVSSCEEEQDIGQCLAGKVEPS